MNLFDFINILKKENELIEIDEPVSTELEITEIVDRIIKSENYNKALLFKNNGTKFPLLINAFGSDKRILLALNSNSWEELCNRINNLINLITDKSSIYKKILKLYNIYNITRSKIKHRKGKCQEVVYNNPDVNILPVLKCWPLDGGRFITLPVVHTLNPLTNKLNTGMYRLQVIDKDKLIVHWHVHKDGAENYRLYREKGLKIPVAITLGGSPVYSYCSTAPLPPQISEYVLAAFLLNKRVKFVKCLTQNIYIPDDVDIVIEGYIEPSEKLALEGPFGDHTGFYSLPDYYPIMHITAITHKKNAFYPSTIVGIPPQEDYYFIKATEHIFKPLLRLMLPEIIDIKMPFYGVAHNLLLIQIKSNYPAHSNKVAHFVWGNGQLMFTKVIIITDKSLDNEKYLFYDILIQENITNRIFISFGPSDVLEHSGLENLKGGKMLIDATNLNTNIDKNFFEEINLKKIFNDYEYLQLNKKAFLINVDITTFNINNLINEIKEAEIFNEEVIIFVKDKNLRNNDFKTIMWHFLSNFDPVCDFIKVNKDNNKKVIIFDGTPKYRRKTTPNPVVMSEEIIKKIDKKWNKIFSNIPLIKSPSLEFKCIFYGKNYFME